MELRPSPGLGTWTNDDPEQCAQTVATAIELGYRHIDTAQSYGNESAVGAGVASADRDDVFVATKVSTENLTGPAVRRTARESADRLGVDAIDAIDRRERVVDFPAEPWNR